jgi:hypothetical protein
MSATGPAHCTAPGGLLKKQTPLGGVTLGLHDGDGLVASAVAQRHAPRRVRDR